MRQLVRVCSFGVALCLIASCAHDTDADSAKTGSLESAFSASASKANVPRDLLVAIAHEEDGLTMPAERAIAIDGEVSSAGPLQIRRGKLDTLRRGAELAATTEHELAIHTDLALEAGARVLAELGQKTGARADDLASWSDAIAEMGGFADEPHRQAYVHRVFAALARGGRFAARNGETIVLRPHDLPVALTVDLSQTLRPLTTQPEYPTAEWFPTSCNDKCDLDRGGATIEFLIIHDTQQTFDAAVATLQNDPKKSTHYIVAKDGRVGQFVPESVNAWQCGNSFYNNRSIGIEHEGFWDQPYTEAQYAASAKLIDYLAAKYGIIRDRAHIIGHEQVPNLNFIPEPSPPCMTSPKECDGNQEYGGANHHTDPGDWEWPTYMARFGGTAKCNDATALWACSTSKAQAFRCANGAVEVANCDAAGACEDAPGKDAICHMLPKPPPPSPTDPPASENPGDAPPPPSTPPAPAAAPGGNAASSGCAVGHSSGSAWQLAMVAALAIAAKRRRRR
jgi:MYXO-CTERM domain-containing protein